jgi:hypothetical protein
MFVRPGTAFVNPAEEQSDGFFWSANADLSFFMLTSSTCEQK